tara:strand:- start:347 stop:1105 length:759 start_codon:yes stop_codon:yes gene_type:complete
MLNFLKIKLNQIFGYFGFQIINKKQKIIELTDEDKDYIKLVSKFSMTTEIRIYSLIQSLKYIKYKNIKGDFVECGVWKGGNIILFKKFLEKYFKQEDRQIYAYDTYEGMNKPSDFDYNLQSNKKAEKLLLDDKNKITNIWGIYGLDQVKTNLINNTDNLNNIIFIKGEVEKTLDIEKNLPSKISILRLDTDWYESTKKELEVLYDRVTSGGVIIIDDYGHWGGSKKAVDEFFKNKHVWMHYIDYACRLIIKE